MVVCSVQPFYRYSGLSTDVKPTQDIKDASTFWETDTGREFEWRETAWFEKRLIVDSLPPVYTSRVDSISTSGVIYVGDALTGSAEGSAVWRIRKISTASVMSGKFAGGKNEFNQKWSDRLTLSYL